MRQQQARHPAEPKEPLPKQPEATSWNIDARPDASAENNTSLQVTSQAALDLPWLGPSRSVKRKRNNSHLKSKSPEVLRLIQLRGSESPRGIPVLEDYIPHVSLIIANIMWKQSPGI